MYDSILISLKSALEQTLKPIEIIIVDDGSDDETQEVVQEYASPLVRVLYQDNRGAGSARNNGIRHAQGKYVFFMDADDRFPTRDCLEVLYYFAELNAVNICGGLLIYNIEGVMSMTEAEKHLKDRYFTDKIVKIVDYDYIYGNQRFLFLRKFLVDNNLMYPSYRRFEDPVFAVRALCCAGSFFGVSKIVYEHRWGYKKIKFTLEMTRDILRGIRDVFCMAENFNLDNMYEYCLKYIMKPNRIYTYKYSFCGYPDIDDIIYEINNIIYRWKGNKDCNALRENDVISYKEKYVNQYKNLIKTLEENSSIIVYGAGYCAEKFFELFRRYLKHVVGVAVTAKDKDLFIAGMSVHEIGEFLDYKENTLILIVTSQLYQKEIYDNLHRLGFKNVENVDVNYDNLSIAAELIFDRNDV